jgi:predicted Zn finger-like uncharacterized protein
MLIVCPSCATSYDVELASLRPDGRRVRCVRCRTVWRAQVGQADKVLAAADTVAPERQQAEAEIAPFAGGIAPPPPAVAVPAEADRPDPPTEGSMAAASAAPDGYDGTAAATEGDGAVEEPGAVLEVEAPPIVPADPGAGPPPQLEIEADRSVEQAATQPEDIETYAARQEQRNAKRRLVRWPLSSLHSGVLALIIIDGILVGWRNDFVRMMPQTASFYAMMGLSVNLRGLAFDGVTTTTEQHDGGPILVVEGNIANTTAGIADVPRLKFALRNAAHQEIYSWTAVPPRTTLPPGQTVSFRSRLASPPPEAHDLLVRFVTRLDITGGTH